jgi:hypothetical protein
MEKVIVDGVTFRRYPNSTHAELAKYFLSSPEKRWGYKTKSLHRYIWEKYKGKIPKGFHVHHKDHNPANNDISNLLCISPKQHNGEHYQEMLPKWQKNIEEKARPKAIEWHKSKKAKAFHKRIAKLSWKNKKFIAKICLVCKKEYKTPFPTRSKYCSLNCRATSVRRRKGIRPRIFKRVLSC